MDRHRALVDALARRVLEQPGEVASEIRRAASRNDGSELPEALRVYVDTVERHAHLVTDEQVLELEKAGYSQDQLFEITVAAAVGAALRRLEAGLAPLAEVSASPPRAGKAP